MRAGNLSFGEMRRLEMARALASDPCVPLLDEPAAGASLEDAELLAERIQTVRDRGVTVLLIEHMLELVMGITGRIAVLNFGQEIAGGHRARSRTTPWSAPPTAEAATTPEWREPWTATMLPPANAR